MGIQKYRADYAEAPQANGAIPYFTRWMGGPSLAKIAQCPCANWDRLAARTVYITGEPDTYFSIPAACSFKGRRVKGYVTTDDDGCYVFHVMDSEKEKGGPT
jgi:hypothetical protein